MKNVGAMQPKFRSDSFKMWLVGMACGLLLATIIVVGTGRLALNRMHNTQPIIAVQQAPMVTGVGAVPPAIDEFQQYHVFQQAVLRSAELVPPIDEIAQYRRIDAAANAAAESAPPPIDEFQQYRQQLDSVLNNSAPSMPIAPGTKY